MRRTPALLAVASATVAALVLSGCSSSAAKPAAPGSPAATAAAATFPITEGSATVAAKPTKIVSLSSTATDMLVAIGAGSQITAVDQYSADDFSGCQNLHLSCSAPSPLPPHNLDAYKPNAETIAALGPDLVVIASDENKIQESLTALKIPVYVAPAAVTIDDTYKQMTELGALTGNPAGAAAAVAAEKKDISDAMAKLKPRSTPLSYYFELDQTYYTVTSKTFIGSIFAQAHMVNIADPSDADGKAGGYPQLSAEVIIKANPDVIFLADTVCCTQSAATVAARPGWSTMTAVAQDHVVGLDDSVASQWGTGIPALVTQIVTESNSIPVP